MNVLLIPTLAFDLTLLDRVSDTIDYPIKHKVLIGNGRPGSLDEWGKKHKDWTILQQTENLGVAGSWNMAPKLFPDEKCWFICNDDIWFDPGAVQRVCEFSDEHCDECDIIGNNCMWASFTWTPKGVRRFGTFDENLWPAYHEDQDMGIRINAGARPGCPEGVRMNVPVDGPLIHHGKPRCGGVEYTGLIGGVSLFQREYIYRKWGLKYLKPGEPYHFPFNNPNNPPSYWKFEPYRRRILQGIWDTFMQQENPSIYD